MPTNMVDFEAMEVRDVSTSEVDLVASWQPNLVWADERPIHIVRYEGRLYVSCVSETGVKLASVVEFPTWSDRGFNLSLFHELYKGHDIFGRVQYDLNQHVRNPAPWQRPTTTPKSVANREAKVDRIKAAVEDILIVDSVVFRCVEDVHLCITDDPDSFYGPARWVDVKYATARAKIYSWGPAFESPTGTKLRLSLSDFHAVRDAPLPLVLWHFRDLQVFDQQCLSFNGRKDFLATLAHRWIGSTQDVVGYMPAREMVEWLEVRASLSGYAEVRGDGFSMADHVPNLSKSSLSKSARAKFTSELALLSLYDAS